MRHDRGMAKPAPDLELDLVSTGTSTKGGVIRGVFRLITLPFRIVIGVIGVILIPVRLAIALIRRIVALAADITFAIWRAVKGLIGLVLGAVLLVFRLVFGVLRLVLKIVTLGKFGKSRKAKAAGALVAAGSVVARKSSGKSSRKTAA